MANFREGGARAIGPRVLLVGDPRRQATREKLLGALSHARSQDWRVVSAPGWDAERSRTIAGAVGELFAPGALHARSPHPLSLSIAAVDCSDDWSPPTTYPRVQINHSMTGALAARHLLATAFERFFFLGHDQHAPSAEQLDGFARQLRRSNYGCASHLVTTLPDGSASGVIDWVASLPQHSAVWCSDDELGVRVLQCCAALERLVPDDVAVLGTGNDPWLCALASPALSSIALPHRSLGRAAAVLLSHLMQGERPPPHVEQMPPLEVVPRPSTLTFAGAPPAVQRAIAFMREHAQRGIRIQDVIDHAKLSRRSLELYVQALLGCSPHQELVRLRLGRAQRLLQTSGLALQEVAHAAGFSDGRQMSETFRRQMGLTPSQYRRQQRRNLRDPEELPR